MASYFAKRRHGKDVRPAVNQILGLPADRFVRTIVAIGHPTEAALSIGVALTLGGALDVPGLLAQADEALYYAKARGRNRVEFATADLVLHRKDAASPPLVEARTAA